MIYFEYVKVLVKLIKYLSMIYFEYVKVFVKRKSSMHYFNVISHINVAIFVGCDQVCVAQMLFHILMLQYLLIVYLSYNNCNLINQQFFLVYSRAVKSLPGFVLLQFPVHYSNCVAGNLTGQENQGSDRAV
ncbi:hypothetical protein RchiOBHm_Chr4g0392621 [Rosa chinensis]|uniref:Uncharacterized protein n=1 Tax=Rosa chinensis TaxID=74649 RepID=A0A2P6QQS9_ROSCH|nr:hypothetical protein RchiOBHm_Chr4g0392621 [Rosa chinensis]